MPNTKLSFALNHTVAPSLSPEAFFKLCRTLGIGHAELRNDLPDNAILNGTPATEIQRLAASHAISLASIIRILVAESMAFIEGRLFD
jgi:2-keto-myo-inositol isomerase